MSFWKEKGNAVHVFIGIVSDARRKNAGGFRLYGTINSAGDHVFLRPGLRVFWFLSEKEHPDGVNFGEFHALHFTLLCRYIIW